MTNRTVSPLAVRDRGTRLRLDVNQFPVGATVLRLTMTRVSWPLTRDDSIASIELNWGGQLVMATTVPGGIITSPGGTEATESGLTLGIPVDAVEKPDGTIERRKRDISTGRCFIDFFNTLETEIVLEAV